MRNLLAGLMIAALGLIAGSKQIEAAPITYTISGTATGTVGDTPFTNAAFSIQAVADTNDVEAFIVGDKLGGYLVPPSTTTIAIAGIGSGQFAQFPAPGLSFPIWVFDNQISNTSVNPPIGPNIHLNILTLLSFLVLESPSFATYDLKGPIGPNTGTFDERFTSQLTNFNSTLGPITFTSVGQNGTFTAAFIPEPTSLVLPGMGLLGPLGVCWLRRARSAPAREC